MVWCGVVWVETVTTVSNLFGESTTLNNNSAIRNVQNKIFRFRYLVTMTMTMAISNSLDQIISSVYVRTSNLHFTYQETPFSLYLTIRKTTINKDQASVLQSRQMNVQQAQHDVEALKTENLSLKTVFVT